MLERLKQQKFMTQQRMLENQAAMQNRMLELETQRRAMAELLEMSAVKIQKVARGFITRTKIKNVQRWKEDFERAKL